MVKEILYSFTLFISGKKIEHYFIQLNNSSGLYAEYQSFGKGIKFYNFNDNSEEEDKDKIKPLKQYNLKNEDFGLKGIDKLFNEIDKIKLPEDTDCIDKSIIGKPRWHLTIDEKEYIGNNEPEFYTKIFEILKIDDIKKYVKNNF